MSELKDIFSQCVLKQQAKIKAICAPLHQYFGISFFTYASIHQDGTFANLGSLGSSPEALEIYYTQKLYLTDPHTSHPHLLRSGFLSIPNTYAPDYMRDIFAKSDIANLWLLVQRSEDRVELYFFGVRKKEALDCSHISLPSCPELFHRFRWYFKKEAKAIIQKMRAEGYNIKRAKGKVFLEHDFPSPLLRKDPRIQQFLKAVFPLSNREQQCLEMFKQGNSAQMTGAILGLSRRTVEHYFDNIKNKLGCQTKADLLQW